MGGDGGPSPAAGPLQQRGADDQEVDPLVAAFELSSTVLGRGSEGRVVLAYARDAKMIARALKFKDPRRTDYARIVREIEILQSLRHRHIVPLIDHFPPASARIEHVFVFPERECSLHRFLQRRVEGLPPGVLREWSRQLLSALAQLRAQCIIHGDLKPGNILVKWDNDSANLAVELTDFGSARRLETGRRRRGKFAANGGWTEGPQTLRPGSCKYSAPERWWCTSASKAMCEYSADVWSYGIVVFEMLTVEELRVWQH